MSRLKQPKSWLTLDEVAEYLTKTLKEPVTAEDPQVRENAERARENLSRLSRFDYLDVE